MITLHFILTFSVLEKKEIEKKNVVNLFYHVNNSNSNSNSVNVPAMTCLSPDKTCQSSDNTFTHLVYQNTIKLLTNENA